MRNQNRSYLPNSAKALAWKLFGDNLLHFCSRVILNVFLSSAPVVSDFACGKIDIIAYDSRPPRRRQEFGEGAFARLVSSQRSNQCITIKRRYVYRAGN